MSLLEFGSDEFGGRFGPPTQLETDLLGASETRLLLLAGRSSPPDRLPEHAVAAVGAGIDWARFMRLVASHRLMPLVAPALAGIEVLPPEIEAGLLRMRTSAAKRSLMLAAECERVTAALDAEAIPSIGLKGPGLATWLYDNVTGRAFVDLDLLVEAKRIGDAVDAMAELGYGPGRSGYHLRAQDVETAARYFGIHDAKYFNPKLGVSVELHWKAVNDPVFSSIERGLAATLDRSRAAHAPIAPAATAAYVLIHGSDHGYRRLHWLADSARLAEILDPPTWAQILAMGQADSVEPALLVGPYLAHRLFGAPIPDPVGARLEKRLDAVRRAAEHCLTRAPNRPDATSLLWMRLGLRDRTADRVRLLRRTYMMPTHAILSPATLRPGWRGTLSRALAQNTKLAKYVARLVRRSPSK